MFRKINYRDISKRLNEPILNCNSEDIEWDVGIHYTVMLTDPAMLLPEFLT